MPLVLELGASMPASEPLGTLGIWTLVPQAQASAFDPGSSESDLVVFWRANLSTPDLDTALAAGKAQLEITDRALTEAGERLDVLLATLQALCTPGHVAFNTDASPLMLADPPEAELLIALAALEAHGTGVSYGLSERLPANLVKAMQQSESWIERLRQIMANYVCVETMVEGQPVARTTVGWSSDTGTVWQTPLNPVRLALHRRMFELVLESRALMLRTLLVLLEFAIKISALLAMHAAPVLLIPVLWDFVNQVCAQRLSDSAA